MSYGRIKAWQPQLAIMSFQLIYIPYTKFPMFMLQGIESEGYPENAYVCTLFERK